MEEEEFITCKQAVSLKELGFNKPCIAIFNIYENKRLKPDIIPIRQNGSNKPNGLWDWTTVAYDKKEDDILAPTRHQAFKWFREKHNQHSFIHYHSKPEYTIRVYDDITLYWSLDEKISFKTYEEAESACLDKLIEIVKNKKDEKICS